MHTSRAGCAPDVEKFEQTLFNGDSNFSLWYTPEDYAVGTVPMRWADPSVVAYGNDAPEDGDMMIGQVSGKQFSFREGRGVTSDFLEYQLTDGKPLSSNDDLWIPYKRTAINTVKAGSGKIKGIHVNQFYPEVIVDKTDAGIAASEVYISYLLQK